MLLDSTVSLSILAALSRTAVNILRAISARIMTAAKIDFTTVEVFLAESSSFFLLSISSSKEFLSSSFLLFSSALYQFFS